MTLKQVIDNYRKMNDEKITHQEFGKLLREYAKATYDLSPKFVEVFDPKTPLYKRLISADLDKS